MRKVLVIAAREYKAAVKTKSFVIGVVLMPIMMGGTFLAQAVVGNQVDARPKHFVIVDRTQGQQFKSLLEEKAKEHNQKQLTSDSPTTAPFFLESVLATGMDNLPELRLALSDRIRKGELTGFLEIGPDVLKPPPAPPSGLKPEDVEVHQNTGRRERTPKTQLPAYLEPYSLRYQTNRPSYQDFSQWAEALVSVALRSERAKEKGIDLADVNAVDRPVPLFSRGLTKRNPATGAIEDGAAQNPIVATLLPGGLLVLMFMMLLMGAAPLLHGVMEEKMQRIAEVLLGSVQPFPLMMGKIIGMALVSLTMTAIYLVGIYLAVNSYGYGEYLSAPVLAWFLLYQVLALFMYGSLYAAVGAACSDLKEAQAMLMPISLISIIPLFVWINVVREPTSTFATWISFVPLFTPMLMVARLAVPPGIAWWQPVLGVVLVLLMTTLCVYAAGRIFRVGILLQGKGPRLSEMLRWVFRG